MNTKEINELILTYNIFADDTVVIEQNGVAKRIKAHLFLQQDKDRFKGWFISSAQLSQLFPVCSPGDYAYVGTLLNQSVVYRCATANTWTNTNEAVSLPVIDLTPLTTRIDKVERDMVQLEQDLSVVRGDVHGLIGYRNNKSTPIKRNTTYEYWIIPDSGKLMIGSDSWTNIGFEVFSGDCFFNNQKNQVRCGSYRDGAPLHLCYSINSDNVATWCMNGVKGITPATEINDNLIADIFVNLSTSTHILLHKRVLNTSLTQQQFDYLYNQGRCDEVVLGDEWRRSFFEIKNTESNISCSIENVLFNGVQSVKITQISNEGAGLGVAINGLNDNKTGYYEYLFKMYIPSESTAVRSSPTSDFTTNGKQQRIYDNVDLSKRNQWQDVRVLVYVPDTTGNGIFRAYFNYNIGDYTTIYFSDKVSVKSVDVLNEYLPSYLTKTQWIDTGVNKQDIAITAPAFTYIKPYKQYSFASGAPSTPPAAAFVEYTDVDTGNIWKSCGKRNTEQFGVQHYKQINN